MMQPELKRKLEEDVARFYEIAGPAFSSTRHGPWDVMDLLAKRIKPGERVVDVGAGNGRLADVLPQGVDYLGIEPSAALRASVKPDFQKYLPPSFPRRRESRQDRQKQNPMDPGFTNSDSQINKQSRDDEGGAVKKIIAGSLPKLDLPDGYADAVACIAVLHHIPTDVQRQSAVAELHRILKPGGLLLCTVLNLRSLRFRRRKFVPWRALLAAWLRIPGFKGAEKGDTVLSWRAEGKNEKRYVHAFTRGEFGGMFNGKDWIVEKIGFYDRGAWRNALDGRNLVALVRRR